MDIHEATRRYERWLSGYMKLVATDLNEKHRRMREGVFPFMRATFYRWCQLWRVVASEEKSTFSVFAVGDLHVENFGTWRDVEGRLIWGINDFDEATVLPWSQDLARLAASANLAIVEQQLGLSPRDASEAILQGYAEGIERGGQPFVLEESHTWLRRAATGALRDPTVFWKKMEALPTARAPAREARAALARAMPEPGLRARICRRIAGMGSLGRPRFVAVAAYKGGRVARETKATAPSALVWATGQSKPGRGADLRGLARAVRVPDPTMHLAGSWLVRRLAPDCSRIPLGDLPEQREEDRLLNAMGFETANIHLGTRGARERIRRELRARARGGRWLNDLAKTLAAAVADDWQHWCQSRP